MLSEANIQALAVELQQSQQTRVQIEHFSKRFPEMTLEDGYKINRAWVQLQIADGAQVIGHKIGFLHVGCCFRYVCNFNKLSATTSAH